MPMGSEADAQRLRTALRDLVALSTVPAAWVGREPPAIAAGLADVLVNSLHLDFAFVRLCDPNGGTTVEIARGSAWHAFPEWLQSYLSDNGRSAGSFRMRSQVASGRLLGKTQIPYRSMVIPSRRGG